METLRPKDIELEDTKPYQDFLNLTVEQQNELKERISKSNGILRVVVHPDYKHPSLSEIDNRIYNLWGGASSDTLNMGTEDLAYKKASHKVFSSAKQHDLPILVFEDERKLQNGNSPYTEYLIDKNVYTIPTLPDSPYPSIKDKSISSSSFSERLDKRYLDDVTVKGDNDLLGISIILQDYGVKKAIIGGAILAVYKKRPFGFIHPKHKLSGQRFGGDQAYASGCAGQVGNIFKESGLDVTFSNISGIMLSKHEFPLDSDNLEKYSYR